MGSVSSSPREYWLTLDPYPKHPGVRAQIVPLFVAQVDFPSQLRRQSAASFLIPFRVLQNGPPPCAPAHARR